MSKVFEKVWHTFLWYRTWYINFIYELFAFLSTASSSEEENILLVKGLSRCSARFSSRFFFFFFSFLFSFFLFLSSLVIFLIELNLFVKYVLTTHLFSDIKSQSIRKKNLLAQWDHQRKMICNKDVNKKATEA